MLRSLLSALAWSCLFVRSAFGIDSATFIEDSLVKITTQIGGQTATCTGVFVSDHVFVTTSTCLGAQVNWPCRSQNQSTFSFIPPPESTQVIAPNYNNPPIPFSITFEYKGQRLTGIQYLHDPTPPYYKLIAPQSNNLRSNLVCATTSPVGNTFYNYLEYNAAMNYDLTAVNFAGELGVHTGPPNLSRDTPYSEELIMVRYQGASLPPRTYMKAWAMGYNNGDLPINYALAGYGRGNMPLIESSTSPASGYSPANGDPFFVYINNEIRLAGFARHNGTSWKNTSERFSSARHNTQVTYGGFYDISLPAGISGYVARQIIGAVNSEATGINILENYVGATGSPLYSPIVSGYKKGQLQVVELNGDGRKDLVLQDNQNRFFYSLANPDGSYPAFTSAPVVLDNPPNPLPLPAASGGSFVAGQASFSDVNGDGRADLVWYQNGYFNVYLWEESGRLFHGVAGTTVPATSPQRFAGGSSAPSAPIQPGQAQFADFNGDGVKDLIFQDQENAFWVYVSNQNSYQPYANNARIFRDAPATPSLKHGGVFVEGLALYSDLNGDNRADLTWRLAGNQFAAYYSNGVGQFVSGVVSTPYYIDEASGKTLNDGAYRPGQIKLVKLSSDAKADIFFETDDNFYMAKSNGPIFSLPKPVLPHGGVFLEGVTQYADVTGKDGVPEIIWRLTNNLLAIYPFDPASQVFPGSWGYVGLSSLPPNDPPAPGKINLTDLNADGFEDLIYITDNYDIYVALSAGSREAGGFRPAVKQAAGLWP